MTVGMTMARGSRATGNNDCEGRHDDGDGTTTGGTTTARGSRATGHNDGEGWHDDGDWRHNDGRQDDGKGQKEAAPPPPPAYQPQHHRENVYKSIQLELI